MKALILLFGSLAVGGLARFKSSHARDAPQNIQTYVPTHPRQDNSTYGHIDQVAVTHQHIDWFPNWTQSIVQGSIVFDMVVNMNDIMYVQFDTWNNTIEEVVLQPAGTAMRCSLGNGNIPISTNNLTWTVETVNPMLGQVLVVELP